MAPATHGGSPESASLRLRTLLSAWWQHRALFLITPIITLLSVTIYLFTFLGDRRTPLFDFLKRFEYDTLDTRFRYRPARYTPPDSRIVIVAIDQRGHEHLRQFNEARKLYRQRRWAAAQSVFQAILDRWSNDGPSILYLKRCQEYLEEEPQPDWDAVFTMMHK